MESRTWFWTQSSSAQDEAREESRAHMRIRARADERTRRLLSYRTVCWHLSRVLCLCDTYCDIEVIKCSIVVLSFLGNVVRRIHRCLAERLGKSCAQNLSNALGAIIARQLLG